MRPPRSAVFERLHFVRFCRFPTFHSCIRSESVRAFRPFHSFPFSGVPVSLRVLALQALAADDIAEKLRAVRAMQVGLATDASAHLSASGPLPGRPLRPSMVPPGEVPRRSVQTIEGRAALLHALAHIEFNAINLALDIMWRFADLPERFYQDWLKVAQEEALHFEMLNDHLHVLGFSYGDFSAHDGLWRMAQITNDDLLARLALVPRTLEARGLDASPGIRDKLHQAGDLDAAAILERILQDEIGHVAIGNRWYRWACERDGRDPVAAFRELSRQYGAPRQKGPFNLQARRAAGFDDAELRDLMEP